jgi:hypothetical protein
MVTHDGKWKFFVVTEEGCPVHNYTFFTYFSWHQCDNAHVIIFCYHIVYSCAHHTRNKVNKNRYGVNIC